MKKQKKIFLLILVSLMTAGCAEIGPKGDQGEIGPQGEQGIPGEKGETGPEGPAGKDGKDGVSVVSITYANSVDNVDTYVILYSDSSASSFTVTNGVDGKAGEQGPQGIQGNAGADGHTPIITIGKNGHWFVDGVDTNISAQGPKGDQGETGPEGPAGKDGKDGKTFYSIFIEPNSYVDISYSPKKGDFEIGELITFSFEIKNDYKNQYDIPSIEINDDVVYKEDLIKKDNVYTYQVEMVENGIYVKANTEKTEINLNKNTQVIFDENDYGYVETQNNVISFSKAKNNENALVDVYATGIIFNQYPLGKIRNIKIEFDDQSFGSADLYYGNYMFSTENLIPLSASNNLKIDDNCSYFVVHSTSNNTIKSILIEYTIEEVQPIENIPIVNITTKNNLPIGSRLEYSESKIELIDENSKVLLDNVSAGVKLRGNSTHSCPKKPYRIKFDKKQSIFGSVKAKNWALLADYMDGSLMHNFLALNFAQMVREESEFCCSSKHINVYVNGVYQGVYLLTEQIDEKEGRVNIEQDEGYFISIFNDQNEIDFDKACFMIERDESATSDPSEILDETYFKITLSDKSSYYYSLKYPEKEDFYVDPDDESSFDSEKYYIFLNTVKDYITSVHEMFLKLNSVSSTYDDLTEIVDLESLASYGLVDLFMSEYDHGTKSFKMYKRINERLCFGPNWDYDSCSLQMLYEGVSVDNPFKYYSSKIKDTFTCGDSFTKALLKNENGLKLISKCYRQSEGAIKSSLFSMIENEFELISPYYIDNASLWNKKNYSMVFENILYVERYIKDRLICLDKFL